LASSSESQSTMGGCGAMENATYERGRNISE
jgi:hypothetical protein